VFLGCFDGPTVFRDHFDLEDHFDGPTVFRDHFDLEDHFDGPTVPRDRNGGPTVFLGLFRRSDGALA